jgi:hypothetical protein
MSQAASRRAIHAFVSSDAHDQWHDFAAEEGVSVSALIEAFAPALAEGTTSSESMYERLDAVVTTARGIDAARRRRRRTPV